MSATPRVDAWEQTSAPYADLLNLARDLERELSSKYVSRDSIIEECALAADEFNDPEYVATIVAAIRALKSQSISAHEVPK